jgi:hypothetical protein
LPNAVCGTGSRAKCPDSHCSCSRAAAPGLRVNSILSARSPASSGVGRPWISRPATKTFASAKSVWRPERGTLSTPVHSTLKFGLSAGWMESPASNVKFGVGRANFTARWPSVAVATRPG